MTEQRKQFIERQIERCMIDAFDWIDDLAFDIKHDIKGAAETSAVGLGRSLERALWWIWEA